MNSSHKSPRISTSVLFQSLKCLETVFPTPPPQESGANSEDGLNKLLLAQMQHKRLHYLHAASKCDGAEQAAQLHSLSLSDALDADAADLKAPEVLISNGFVSLPPCDETCLEYALLVVKAKKQVLRAALKTIQSSPIDCAWFTQAVAEVTKRSVAENPSIAGIISISNTTNTTSTTSMAADNAALLATFATDVVHVLFTLTHLTPLA
jgi:hypothetical protein